MCYIWCCLYTWKSPPVLCLFLNLLLFCSICFCDVHIICVCVEGRQARSGWKTGHGLNPSSSYYTSINQSSICHRLPIRFLSSPPPPPPPLPPSHLPITSPLRLVFESTLFTCVVGVSLRSSIFYIKCYEYSICCLLCV